MESISWLAVADLAVFNSHLRNRRVLSASFSLQLRTARVKATSTGLASLYSPPSRRKRRCAPRQKNRGHELPIPERWSAGRQRKVNLGAMLFRLSPANPPCFFPAPGVARMASAMPEASDHGLSLLRRIPKANLPSRLGGDGNFSCRSGPKVAPSFKGVRARHFVTTIFGKRWRPID